MIKKLFNGIPGIILLCFLFLSEIQAQDTIIISPNDTAQLKALPEKIKSIIEKYEEENHIATDTGSNPESILLELDGIILDETISKIGHDFYKYFYDYWSPPEGVSNFTIVIDEKLMPGIGNLVIVKINDDEIFQNRMTPRDYVIESLAKYAINQSRQYLIRYQDIKDQLENEDLKGTGIY